MLSLESESTRTPNLEDAAPKTHPATREMLPDDPLSLHGFEVPGDPDLMLRLLVEDLARMGWGLEPLMDMARNPFYAALHGLYLRFGDDLLRVRITAVLRRVGVMRVRVVEAPTADQLVHIQLPASS